MTEMPKGNPKLLSAMMDVEPANRAWQDDELASIFRHQFAAPLHIDLQSLDRQIQTRLGACSPPALTFSELFHHPHPPADLLNLVKQFSKSSMSDASGPLPREVATVLYFGSIFLAQTRAGTRISRLDDGAIKSGIEWVLSQHWLDPDIRALFNQMTQPAPAPSQAKPEGTPDARG